MPLKPDTRQLWRSLDSTTCPACGCVKIRARSLCGRQFFQLPTPMRRALYRRIGHGYEAAMAEALAFLKVAHFHEPRAKESA